MLKPINAVAAISLVALLMLGIVEQSFAQKGGTSHTTAADSSVPKPAPNKEALADNDVKHLLLLMDTNQNGKITKEDWMKFAESEFDRLDKNKSGELDPKELRKSGVRATDK
jgi:hypothetical protein